MMANDLPDEPRYTRIVTAQLAEISIEFLERCESEQLVQTRVIRGGAQGYSATDIRRIARIARLHDDLGLDFNSLEVVLNMRDQILELQRQIEALEQEKARREDQLLHELTNMRRQLASESKWR
ncbi:MAG: chaperone modulator CbpM [Candidatus Promineifilaceae bacterium]|jgi:DNA-binding transcriptional MerR regulator